MKKTLLLLIALMMLLCGCNINENSVINERGESNAEVSYEGYGSAAPLDEYALNYTDPEGFSYEVTCRISPWILQSDTDNLYPTWNSIAKGKELPTLNTWGFHKNGDTYTYSDYSSSRFESKIDDMYYAVGTISIKNTTDGFSFSKDRIGYPKIQIIRRITKDNEKKLITRVYFGNSERTSALTLKADAKMTSDNWGPVPFVIAFPEHYTSNNPDGENYEKAANVRFYLVHGEVSNQDLVPITVNHL